MFYFKFNIGDYASHTRHLTLVEDIAYRRLLEAYYLSERPLTDSIAAVARHIRMREYEKEVGDVLNEFFTLSELGWSNVRADREIEDYHAKIKQASDAGKTSAKRRLNKNPTTVERPLNDRCDSVEPTTKQETVNKKQETVIRERTARGTRLPKDFFPDLEFAMSNHIQDEAGEFEKFKDYWNSQPGQKGVKLDWQATWRNWCRNAKQTTRPSETVYQRSQRERIERDFPNISNKGVNDVPSITVD